jgi:hypothetical protein
VIILIQNSPFKSRVIAANLPRRLPFFRYFHVFVMPRGTRAMVMRSAKDRRTSLREQGWGEDVSRGNIFRKRANECGQLAARMRNPEHRKFAEDLVRAWIELAELEEREATSAVVFVSDPHSKSDPGPGDPIV